jgi:YegS/Rv2252/BmrU family lipid kinase
MRAGTVLAIVNPASSSGRTLRRWPDLQRSLASRLGDVELRATEAPGHATLLARRGLEQGARLVISIGGDGTNNEVLAGFVDDDGANRFPDAELGLLHSGTGGDFLRHLGRCAPEQAIAALADGTAHAIDYGVARYVDGSGHTAVRPFLNEASAGLSGLVDYHVRRSNRLLGATATYVLGSLRAIADLSAKRIVMTLDGVAQELPLSLAVAANGQYFGGGMWIAPRGRCDDGILEIVHTGIASRFTMAAMLGKVFSGKHIEHPQVTAARAKVMELVPVDPDDVILLDLDGEQPGRLPARFHVVPRGLKLRAAGLPGPARVRD